MEARFKKSVFQYNDSYVKVEIADTQNLNKVVSWELFMWPMWSLEGRFKKAHLWADKQLEVLHKYSSGG